MEPTATPAAPSADAAERACLYLYEVSPEMRGCAIFAAGGALLGASNDSEDWEQVARELATAADNADGAGGEEVSHAHISTAGGEVFLVRAGGLMAVAVCERLTLPALVLFDLRTALKDLAAGRGPR